MTTILLVGGGSGGHITPLLAVAKELKGKKPNLKTIVITERGGKFSHLFEGDASVNEVHAISAGKFRRYHGESLSSRFFDFKTNLLNIRDAFRLGAGLVQSFWFLLWHRPSLIFIKGGYVGVPVGLAARLLRIQYITHDSDALAGLTNRLIGKRAIVNAVGMPPEFYSYPKDKVAFVGVPVGADFSKVTIKEELASKKELGFSSDSLVLLITGGSNGAQRLDTAVHMAAKGLLEQNPKLHIIHQVGEGNEGLYEDYPPNLQVRITVRTFLRPLSSYSAAADLIVARGGATAIAEFAAQNKACIVMPNPYLTGGHQLHNADVLEKSNAAKIVTEEEALNNPNHLQSEIQTLLDNPDQRKEIASNLNARIPTDASKQLADIIVSRLEKIKKNG